MISFRNKKTFLVFNIILGLGGVPIYNVPKSFMYTVFVVTVIFSYFSTISALIIHMYVHFDDLDKAADSVAFLPAFSLCIWIHIYLRIQRRSLVSLLISADCFTWEDLPSKDPITGSTSMTVMIHRIKTATVMLTIICIGFYFVQNVARMFTLEERFLTLEAWYPYDWKKSPAYEITFIVQIINTIGLATILYVFPPLYATLVLIACTQLEKVRTKLSNIKQQLNLSEVLAADDCEKKVTTHNEMFAHMVDQLNDCIRLHQETLRFTKDLEDNFSSLFVGVFVIILLSLCFSSFSAVLRWGNAVNMSQSVASYILFLIIIFMFCWFPSELNDQAQRVRDAAFACDWVGAPASFQRSLLFMIACANKEITLTAGKCVPVSKQTMLSMIQESISLFMFLLQVRDKDAEN